jgi:hypothetical protein
VATHIAALQLEGSFKRAKKKSFISLSSLVYK